MSNFYYCDKVETNICITMCIHMVYKLIYEYDGAAGEMFLKYSIVLAFSTTIFICKIFICNVYKCVNCIRCDVM